MQLDVSWSERVKYIKEMAVKWIMSNPCQREETIDEVTSVWYPPARMKVSPETEMEPSKTKPLNENVNVVNT